VPPEVPSVKVNIFSACVGLVLQVLQEEGVGHYHVALQLRALRKHAGITAVLDLVLQVVGPAGRAELVAASEGHSVEVGVILVEFDEANSAHGFVLLLG